MYKTKDIEEINGEVCLTSAGLIRLIAYTAYRSFEKKPRTKCRQILNLILSIARSRGYKCSSEFDNYFRSLEKDIKKSEILARQVLEFIDPMELINILESF